MLDFPNIQFPRTETYGPPLKGLNSRWAAPVIAKDEASNIFNFSVNEDGTLKTYPGYTLDGSPFPNTTDAFIRSLYDFRRGSALDLLMIAANDTTHNANATYSVDVKQTVGDGTYQYFGHTVGTATFVASNTGVTGTNTHWTSELKTGDKIKATADADSKYTEIASVNSDTSLTLVGGGYAGSSHSGAAYIARKVLNNTAVPRFTTFNNLCLIVNGQDNPQAYDATSLNLITNSYSGTVLTPSGTTSPIAKYVTKHKNRVFMASSSSFPSRLWWSHAFDQTYWDPNSFEDIFPQDGGSICSVVPYNDGLLIFKNTGLIYFVGGNFDDSAAGTVAYVKKIDSNYHIGIIAERSPVVHENVVYFLAQTGVYTIDSRLFAEKVSYTIDPLISQLTFSPTTQANKSYAYNSQSSWNTGTDERGFYAAQDGIVRSFFDQHVETDAYVAPNLCSIAIGTDNTIHVVYVQKANNQKLQYLRLKADNTLLKEDPGVTNGRAIRFCSIAVSPADQTVGIVYGMDATTGLQYITERTPDSGPTLGTWGSRVPIPGNLGAFGTTVQGQLLYSSGGTPCFAYAAYYAVDSTERAQYQQRNAGTWTASNSIDALTTVISQLNMSITMILDSLDNPYIAITHGLPNEILAYHSTNGGATWTQIEEYIAPTDVDPDCSLGCGLDNSSNFISCWSDGVHVIRRNHTAGTSSNIDSSSSHPLARGFFTFFDSDDNYPTGVQEDYAYNLAGIPNAQDERVIFDTTNTLVNPTSNVLAKATQPNVIVGYNATYKPCSNPFVHNGRTTAFISFGTSANQLIIRRVCFKGSWASPVLSDATLTSWGNYNTSGVTTNGNSPVFLVAVASSTFTPHPTSYSTVVPPVLVSNIPADIYVSAKTTVSLTQWAGVAVQNLTLNYVGAGVDAGQSFGTDFYNELYLAGSQNSVTNNLVLIRDIKEAFIPVGYPINCMEMLGTTLYGGSSSNGDLYKLKHGNLFNGSSYNCTYTSKEDFLGSFEFTKEIYKIYVIYEVQPSGSFNFSYRLNNFGTSGGPTWVTTTIDQTGATSATPGMAEIFPVGLCSSVQFKIDSTASNNFSSIIGWSLVYNFKNLR